jgi:ATP/ADP translocase
VHLVTLGIQLVGSALCIRYIGVQRTHLSIPLLLCCNAIALHFLPLFAVASWAFICVKSADFSLFTVLKEVLYNPLKPEEKSRAKAVIDIFAHRSSKALASLFILGVTAIWGSHRGAECVNALTFVLFACWIGVAFWLVKEPVDKKEEQGVDSA